MEELKGKIKHEVSDPTVLQLLESIYQLYRSCNVARTYSDVAETSIAELRGEERIPLQPLFICFVKHVKGNLTFPAMMQWKKRAQFLLIRDEFLPVEYSYNDWKKHDEFKEYVEHKLLTVPVRKIITTPETKTITLRQQSKEFIMNMKRDFDYDTIDDAIAYILQNSTGWKLIRFIARMLHDDVTLREIEEVTQIFGGFVFLFGEQKEAEDKIKVVTEFYPFTYDPSFSNLVNEVEANVIRAK
jgi:hypothetical protein